jgi:hypothetical protein
MTRLRLPVIALSLLISCSARADLRTFDVDPQYQQEVFSALTDILTPDPARGLIMDAHGRVELLPSGQIVVNASAETLEQVEKVLQAIRTQSVDAAPRVALRYWGVLGLRAQDSAANGVGSSPPAMLNEVLGELRRLHGELTFRVIGTAAIATHSGQYGEIEGTTLSVEQTAYAQGDTLNAEISMKLVGNAPAPIGPFNVGDLSLRTTLQRGEFVVLGESYLVAGGVDGRGIDGPVFYIVHWAGE